MSLAETLIAVWTQALAEGRDQVEVDGCHFPVERTHARRLRLVNFEFGGRPLAGIEQNPKTASRWAELARQGKRIMQFSCENRYFANVCEGKLTPYSAWVALDLPE
jgi:hypothetical protein